MQRKYEAWQKSGGMGLWHSSSRSIVEGLEGHMFGLSRNGSYGLKDGNLEFLGTREVIMSSGVNLWANVIWILSMYHI